MVYAHKTGMWAIQWESPEGFKFAWEGYWDGEASLSVFACQHTAEKFAKKLEKKYGYRTRVREILWEK